jgi:hypothetical protein
LVARHADPEGTGFNDTAEDRGGIPGDRVNGPADENQQGDGEQYKRTIHEDPPWNGKPVWAGILGCKHIPNDGDSV